MSDINAEARELKISIEGLTKIIFNRIATEDMIHMDIEIKNRSEKISKLITLFANSSDKLQLVAYLTQIKQIDLNIIQAMLIKREELKCVLQNFGKIKNYINS